MAAPQLRQLAGSSPPRGLILLPAAILAGYLIWGLYLSIADILSFDDFEVYHFIGSVAAERGDNIYELRTPHQQRGPFLYPPSAAVLFVPMSWLPHDLAGVLFAIVKMACLAMLWWGGVRFSGRKPADGLGIGLCMLAAAILPHRGVASDIGNGQINLIVALAAVGGVWLMMLPRSAWAIGAALLAWAIAVKITPALLLAALLVNRKWKALATTVVLAGLMLIALPMAWFGPDAYRKMNGQYREIAARFTFDWASPSEQTTPTELFQFSRLQNGDAATTPADAPEALPMPISGYAGEQLFEPRLRRPAVMFWLVTGLVVGIAYLLWRWRFISHDGPSADSSQRNGGDWTWDVAMLCSLIVLLSPRVQKAHMVILIVPAAWLAGRICAWFASTARQGHPRRAALGLMAYAIISAVLLVGDMVEIPVAGWEQPLRCLPLIGLCMLIAMLAIVGWIDARESRPPPAPSQHAA